MKMEKEIQPKEELSDEWDPEETQESYERKIKYGRRK
jgi:hypothetical protein